MVSREDWLTLQRKANQTVLYKEGKGSATVQKSKRNRFHPSMHHMEPFVNAPSSILHHPSYISHLPMHRGFRHSGGSGNKERFWKRKPSRWARSGRSSFRRYPSSMVLRCVLGYLRKRRLASPSLIAGDLSGYLAIFWCGRMSEAEKEAVVTSGNSKAIALHARCTVLPSVMAMATLPPCFCISPMAVCMVCPELQTSSNRTTFLPDILSSLIRSCEV